MTQARMSRRMRRLKAQGKPGFPCFRCQRVFATVRDRNQHQLDAHIRVSANSAPPIHSHAPGAQTRSYTPPRAAQPSPAAASAHTLPKFIMLVDLVTPDTRTPCAVCRKAPAIPLLGTCATCETLYLETKYPPPPAKPIIPPMSPGAYNPPATPDTEDYSQHPYGFWG